MLQCTHKTLFFLSAALWFIIGSFLFTLGLYFLLSFLSAQELNPAFSLIQLFSAKPNRAVPILIGSVCLFVGYLKGRFILAKSVHREIARISTLPNPTSLKNLYSKRYYLLVILMISLGVSMRYLPIAYDTRGFIDITIGSALIHGARYYLRHLGLSLKKRV